jgi:hypothetical protein
MSEITRFYKSSEDAEQAVEALRRVGYTDDLIKVTPHWAVEVRAPFGKGQAATNILERSHTVDTGSRYEQPREPGLDTISWLSRDPDPGSIPALSGRRSPGAISTLSGRRSPGAIATLSGRKSPGAISKLSGRKSPGAISALSKDRSTGAIARLSAGWFPSRIFGPLLTDSQSPIEPSETLLVDDHGGTPRSSEVRGSAGLRRSSEAR